MTIQIAIQRDIVKALGANAAIVHQQIVWVIEVGDAFYEPHQAGWFTGSSEKLADLSGLSPDQCRRAMAKLLDAGLMEKRQFRKGRGDQTCSYRPTNPAIQAPGDSANPSGDSAESTSGDIAESTSTQEVQRTNTSPTPPEEGAQPELFAGKSGPPPSRKAKREKADAEAKRYDAAFQPLWRKLPSRDGSKSGKGDMKAARRAFSKRIKNGFTAGECLAAVENYIEARQFYEDGWGVPAPVMNGSTFFNSKFELFVEPWTPEQACSYWVAPPGRDKSEFGRGRRLTVSEIHERNAALEAEAS